MIPFLRNMSSADGDGDEEKNETAICLKCHCTNSSITLIDPGKLGMIKKNQTLQTCFCSCRLRCATQHPLCTPSLHKTYARSPLQNTTNVDVVLLGCSTAKFVHAHHPRLFATLRTHAHTKFVNALKEVLMYKIKKKTAIAPQDCLALGWTLRPAFKKTTTKFCCCFSFWNISEKTNERDQRSNKDVCDRLAERPEHSK